MTKSKLSKFNGNIKLLTKFLILFFKLISFNAKSDPIIQKHYGIVQILLEKHISSTRKRYKIAQ